MYVNVNEYMPEYRSRAVVLIVNSLDEVETAAEILKSHTHKFRGVQLKSSLFSTLCVVQLEAVRAVSIILEDVLCLDDVFLKCQGKYLELIVPYSLFDEHLLKRCERVDRVIVSFSCEEELSGLNDLFKAFISFRRFPLVQNVPLCKIDVKHAVEIYMRRERVVAKPAGCVGCLLAKYCSFNGERFVPVPIVDSEKYKGVLAFLSHEDSTARF